MFIGTKQVSDETQDNIVIRSGGTVVLDAGKYVSEDICGILQTAVRPLEKTDYGTVHLQPRGGTVMVGGDGEMTASYTLDVSGTFRCTGSATATSFNATSDYRVKENVQTISGENYIVDHLRPVSYTLKDSQEPHIGFIAHELQEHVPTAVKGEKDGEEMQSVNYSELIPILVKEIQDLKKEVRELKQELKQQKT